MHSLLIWILKLALSWTVTKCPAIGEAHSCWARCVGRSNNNPHPVLPLVTGTEKKNIKGLKDKGFQGMCSWGYASPMHPLCVYLCCVCTFILCQVVSMHWCWCHLLRCTAPRTLNNTRSHSQALSVVPQRLLRNVYWTQPLSWPKPRVKETVLLFSMHHAAQCPFS